MEKILTDTNKNLSSTSDTLVTSRYMRHLPAITPAGLCHCAALASVIFAGRSDNWLPGVMVMVTSFVYQIIATFLIQPEERTESSAVSGNKINLTACRENDDLAALFFAVGSLIAIKPYPGIGMTAISLFVYQRIWFLHQNKSADPPTPLLPDLIKIFSDFRSVSSSFLSYCRFSISRAGRSHSNGSGFRLRSLDRKAGFYLVSMITTFVLLMRN